MNETTCPPKGKLPQFSSYLTSYQIISWIKQGAEHKLSSLILKTSMALIVMATSPHGKSCSIIEDKYACKNIANKELKDRPRLDEELRDSN